MAEGDKAMGRGFGGGVREAYANQVDYCRAAGATVTARVVAAIAALLDDPAAGPFAARIREWPGPSPLADGLPLRSAAAFHALHIQGLEPELSAIYRGEDVDAEGVVRRIARERADALLPWLDGPPQTNEAGRSANFVAGMLWLAGQGLPGRFACLEIGSSAGINLMIDRYRYELGGVASGPERAVMSLAPKWTGPPPPAGPICFASLEGCDVAPLDLSDPAQALRLKAYTWPEHGERFTRLEAAVAAAAQRQPALVAMNAADFVESRLAMPQKADTTRVLMHSIVWQYVPEDQQRRVEAAMAAAAARADARRALAWIAVEADRTLLGHNLSVRYWPGGGDRVTLARAHAHGASVEWLAP